jgi:predicted nucleic acid-binding protein
MQLVVDTNVLISALLARSKTFDVIILGDLELYAPEYALWEIE